MVNQPMYLCRFLPHNAETVAAWVADDRELFWVAPSTESPLTAGKVLAWAQGRGNPFLAYVGEDRAPIGYAELNPLRGRKDQLWVGHVVLAPASRGLGLGVSMMRLLLQHAYDNLQAKLVSLVVFPNNRRAIRCYTTAGFKFRDEQYHKFGRFQKPHRMLHLVSTCPVPAAAR